MNTQTPYPYQERVAQALLAGKSIILQAPTGAGKTRAALWPFLHAQREEVTLPFPAQCIYSVPMRVLATQFFKEYRDISESFSRRFRQPINVSLQTGETPDDPELTADLIFATLDQTLSSLLGVPYSLSRGMANLNVGAVLGSYLVFDEFHLFPHEAAKSTLQLLRTVGRIAPFVLMTATFSKTMLEEIGHLLGAMVIPVPENEVIDIETRRGELSRKQRQYNIANSPLDAVPILNVHDHRSLAVCNMVARAIQLYNDLIARGCQPVPFTSLIPDDWYNNLRKAQKTEDREKHIQRAVDRLKDHLLSSPDQRWTMLLHSRFERPHRQVKEALLQALWNPEGLKGELPSLIVVGTQVVEVGLDISSQTLHTEIAPAASVLQRAGRCARYPGEVGTVHVYPAPEDKRGEPNYAPYGTKIERVVCNRSWEAFKARDGKVLHFSEEQEVINIAHTEADQALLQEMQEDTGRIWARIAEALTAHDTSTRRDLIRNNIQSRTVIVYEAPRICTEENPFVFEGFSLHIGTLSKELEKLQTLCATNEKIDWGLRAVKVIEDKKDSDLPPVYQWYDVEDKDALSGTVLLAVHPSLITYDAERGFQLAKPGDGQYRSKRVGKRPPRHDFGGYRLESYTDHIRRMCQVFEREPFQRRLAWIAHRLAQQEGDWYLAPGLLERAVRLAFALHDVGKLDARWQKWAATYQEILTGERPNFLIAHTLCEKNNPDHEAAQKKTNRQHPKPKTHAGEGADAGAKILFQALEASAYPHLYKSVFTSIARHHSPMVENANPYFLHEQAKETLAETFAVVGDDSWKAWSQALKMSSKDEPNIQKRLVPQPPDADYLWWWLYFVIVRNLRLCDGRSQERNE
ncbi:MAG: CRISPR-associated helicase/endonuclease Cas3 [Anaerolineales bacterium]